MKTAAKFLIFLFCITLCMNVWADFTKIKTQWAARGLVAQREMKLLVDTDKNDRCQKFIESAYSSFAEPDNGRSQGSIQEVAGKEMIKSTIFLSTKGTASKAADLILLIIAQNEHGTVEFVKTDNLVNGWQIIHFAGDYMWISNPELGCVLSFDMQKPLEIKRYRFKKSKKKKGKRK